MNLKELLAYLATQENNEENSTPLRQETPQLRIIGNPEMDHPLVHELVSGQVQLHIYLN
jgi:hypothetical protein